MARPPLSAALLDREQLQTRTGYGGYASHRASISGTINQYPEHMTTNLLRTKSAPENERRSSIFSGLHPEHSSSFLDRMFGLKETSRSASVSQRSSRRSSLAPDSGTFPRLASAALIDQEQRKPMNRQMSKRSLSLVSKLDNNQLTGSFRGDIEPQKHRGLEDMTTIKEALPVVRAAVRFSRTTLEKHDNSAEHDEIMIKEDLSGKVPSRRNSRFRDENIRKLQRRPHKLY